MRKSFMKTTMDELDELYRIDLRSVYAMTQALVPQAKPVTHDVTIVLRASRPLGGPLARNACTPPHHCPTDH